MEKMLVSVTPREVDVLRTHVKKVYRKLGVHSAGAAVMRAVELRLIP